MRLSCIPLAAFAEVSHQRECVVERVCLIHVGVSGLFS